jgi:hypothetical protein
MFPFIVIKGIPPLEPMDHATYQLKGHALLA